MQHAARATLSPVRLLSTLGAAAALLFGCLQLSVRAFAEEARFGATVAKGSNEAGEWPSPGGDATGAYYSPLAQINAANIDQVGFAWHYPLHTARGLEATPVVVGGVMYASGNWGRTYALDAASGRERWTFVPQMDAQWGRYACCDVVNRGVAVANGRVYVASLDGYLYSLDAASGRVAWKSDTLPARGNGAFHYFITGAPVIAADLVLIGSGGADFRGGRGFIAAYDVKSGALRWRFYTVPRDPRLGPQDQPHLQAAQRSWPADYEWSMGGGGTVWDGISYDPSLDLVFFGTGNPSPYFVGKDAPPGDALYAASILAVKRTDGTLKWHYQEVPGDGWDYDATQKLILTDLQIGAETRSVLMQAAKNGYFYLLDRRSGELLSARPFTFINWSTGLDADHRPIRNPAADYATQPRLVFPAMAGAHSWQPMSASALTGLVYIPVIDASMVLIQTDQRPAGLIEGNFNLAGLLPEDYDPQGLAALFGELPPLAALATDLPRTPRSRGALRALDPRTGRIVWEQAGQIWDGGVLSTAGNLVLRGDVAGYLNVYAADRGRLLRRIDIGTSIMAAPMSYQIAGQQYIAFMAGYGGGTLAMPYPPSSAARHFGNAGRIVALRLGGGQIPHPPPLTPPPLKRPAPREGSQSQIALGRVLYNRFCARCHVFGEGLLPDLRHLRAPLNEIFYDIVLRGAFASQGMGRWDDVLSLEDAKAIYAYLLEEAWQEYTRR